MSSSDEKQSGNLQPIEKVALLLKLTDRRVRQLGDDGWLPRPTKGMLPVVPCVHGYIDFLKSTIEGEDGERIDFKREKAMLTRAQRLARELKNDELAGKLCRVDDVQANMMALFKTFVGTLEVLPDLLERDAGLSGAAVTRVQEIIDECRERLHRQL